MKLQLLGTPVMERTLLSKQRIILNEGSSRSTKTYSTMQVLVTKLYQERGITITVVRKTLPSLKATAYRDFLEILKENGLYNVRAHNKTDLTYKIRGNEIEFISVDDSKKVKGRKRDYLFVNEANELTHDDFTQLALRTTKQIYLDYNPSHDDDHWIETKVKTRTDVDFFHSTYKDNPFLEDEIVREIENLQHTDQNLWRIYGLGIRGIAQARIYTHFQLIDEMPAEYNEELYGLDFGFNNPSGLLRIVEKDDAYYIDELLYETGLLNSDLIARMETTVNKNKFLFCDSDEPDRIEEIRRAGFNAHKADKDVAKGIDTVKSKRIFITKRSVNLLNEANKYSWKVTSDGKILDEPVKMFDHLLDASRYCIHTYQQMKAKQPNVRAL